MPEEPRQRIGSSATFFLLLTAILFDGIQFLAFFIPGVNIVVEFLVTTVALVVFGIWFAILGVNYFSGSNLGTKVAAMFGGTVIELVPLLDALPGITLSVWGIIWATKKEDAAKREEYSKKLEEVRQIQIAQQAALENAYQEV